MTLVNWLKTVAYICCLAVSGDLGGGQAGVQTERREGQPWLETLGGRGQTLPGGLTESVMIIRFTRWI